MPKSNIPNKSIAQHLAFHDRPLENFRAPDRLGTFPFARHLATRIVNWPHDEPLVIAVYGAWGTGKSTIKNLAVEHIKVLAPKGFVFIPFNPWVFAGQEQLHDAFFRELTRALENEKEPDSRQLAEEVKNWSVAIRGAASLLPMFFALRFGREQGELAKGFLESLHPVFERQSEILKDTKPLETRRQALTKRLTAFRKKLLIVIDDIDRLSTAEIGQLFQLIKAHGDFPKVHYLLLFDKEVVEDALGRLTQEGRGADYLEKIVQIGLHQPKIQDALLHRYLTELIEQAANVVLSADDRWTRMLAGGLGSYFCNLRRVHRFINSLTFQLGAFSGEGSLEVNLTDLIALESLRLFETNIYSFIFENMKMFAPHPSILKLVLSSKKDMDLELKVKAQQAYEFVRQSSKTPEQAVKIVQLLFPGWARLLEKDNWISGDRPESISEDDMYKQSRICHHRLVRKYFYLLTPSDDIPRAEIEKWIRLAHQPKAFAKRLEKFLIDGLLPVALDYLANLADTIEPSFRPCVIAGLYLFLEQWQDDSGYGRRAVSDAVSYMLKAYKSKRQRVEAFRQSVELAPRCVYGPLFLVQRDNAFAEAQARTLCLDRLGKETRRRNFVEHPHLYEILRMWARWEPDTTARYTEKLTATAKGVVSLLETSINIWSRIGMDENISEPLISLNGLSEIVSLDELSKRVGEIVPDYRLTERQHIAVERFKAADARRQQGLPVDDDSLWNAWLHQRMNAISGFDTDEEAIAQD